MLSLRTTVFLLAMHALTEFSQLGTTPAYTLMEGQPDEQVSITRSALPESFGGPTGGKSAMKRIAMTVLTMCALMTFATQANAQGFGYGGGGYGGGYGGYGGGWGGFGSYFGNGGHDFQPHWHATQTPYGTAQWYGNGPHDAVPHHHTKTPWSYQGYSNTGAGPTTSFYSPQPYYFAPW